MNPKESKEAMMGMVKTILESTKDVFIHDHGAFTNECGPLCGWYVATRKDVLDKTFEDEVEAIKVDEEDADEN